MKDFLDKLQDEINIANNRSTIQGGDAIEKARFEGKRDGLVMVRDELKKFISVNNCVSGNEANPEKLQSGEVAVCDCPMKDLWWEKEIKENKCDYCDKPIKQTDR